MSCKVFETDAPGGAAPPRWKNISKGGVEVPAEQPAMPVAVPLDQLRREWEQRAREAQAAGFREGEAAGRNRAAAEYQAIVEKFAQTAGEVAQLRARLRREAEADTLKLALAIAGRVLRRELAVDPGALEALLLGALEKLRGQEITRVRVNPAHAGVVSACLGRCFAGTPVEVIADGSRPPGTAVFETPRGNLDASVESQLQEIERGLTDRLRNPK